MAAGMVPPFASFIATSLFKEKYNDEEKESGITNIVLGASLVTEGAIPFALRNPKHVLPSFVIGSALTGALVMMSNILSVAPHGGLFVIFLVSKPFLYLIYIIMGSLVSSLLMGLSRKSV